MISDSKNIVFVGMPVADILIGGAAAPALMQRYGMKPGVRSLLTHTQVAGIEEELPEDAVVAPGGSMANTACTVSRLCPELDLTFLCLAADDRYGDIFLNALHDAGLMLRPGIREGQETSRSYVITDATGERAIARYMGDSMSHLRVSYLDEAMELADIIFLEGELLALPEGYALWDELLVEAKKHNVAVGLTLFGAEQIRQHRKKYLETIEEHAALVFGNEEELQTLYPDMPDAEAYNTLASTVFANAGGKAVCISYGEAEARLQTPEGIFRSVPPKVEKVVNTLGAGDAFMSGVLTGLLKGYTPDDALTLGHRIAGAVIAQEAPQLADPAALLR